MAECYDSRAEESVHKRRKKAAGGQTVAFQTSAVCFSLTEVDFLFTDSVKYSSTSYILPSLSSQANSIHHQPPRHDRGCCPSSPAGGPSCCNTQSWHHPWRPHGCRMSHLLPGVQPVQQMPPDARVPPCFLHRVPPEDPALPMRTRRPPQPISHPMPPLPPPHPSGGR